MTDFRFTLFTSGAGARTDRAVAVVRRVCGMPGVECAVEYVDAAADPGAALDAGVSTTPTLVREWPLPRTTIVGDIAEESVVARLMSMPNAPDVVRAPAGSSAEPPATDEPEQAPAVDEPAAPQPSASASGAATVLRDSAGAVAWVPPAPERAAPVPIRSAATEDAAEMPDDLLVAFADIATALASSDFAHALQQIVDFAVTTIDGCEHAAITIVDGRHVATDATTGKVPMIVDAIQYDTGEGPCLDAIRDEEIFCTGDLRQESRWPHFADRAVAEAGVLSMLCFRLFIDGDTMGALNTYSTSPDAFTRDSQAVGAVLAAHAAVAMQSSRRQQHVEQLQHALESRTTIGQAVGMLMAAHRVDADQGFDMLRTASQRLNVKLRDVAEQVVDSGATSSSN